MLTFQDLSQEEDERVDFSLVILLDLLQISLRSLKLHYPIPFSFFNPPLRISQTPPKSPKHSLKIPPFQHISNLLASKSPQTHQIPSKPSPNQHSSSRSDQKPFKPTKSQDQGPDPSLLLDISQRSDRISTDHSIVLENSKEILSNLDRSKDFFIGSRSDPISSFRTRVFWIECECVRQWKQIRKEPRRDETKTGFFASFLLLYFFGAKTPFTMFASSCKIKHMTPTWHVCKLRIAKRKCSFVTNKDLYCSRKNSVFFFFFP